MLDVDDLNREHGALGEMLLLLNERIRRLVSDNAQIELDQEAYHREYDALSAQYEETANRIRAIDEELRSREARKKQIELFLRMFERMEADVEFDAGIFVAMVEKVTVNRTENGKGINLRFILRSGQSLLIETKKKCHKRL